MLLERCDITITSVTIDSTSSEEYAKSSLEILLKKGNERLRWNLPHSCCICEKIFTCRKSLKEHLQRLHLKATKMLCDLCPKIFFTKHSMIVHMPTHRTTYFMCNICDYKTINNSRLESHKRTHNKNSECQVCKKRVANFKVHMTSHEPKVECTICLIKFKKLSMKIHIKKVHQTRKCSTCSETFNDREELRRWVYIYLKVIQMFKVAIADTSWESIIKEKSTNAIVDQFSD